MNSASNPSGASLGGAPLDRAALEALILDLLTAAATAHGIHEAEDLGGVYDEQWPAWYTAHMVDALVARGYAVTKGR
ncbi:hypothetical protein ET445_09865 [Agromyces protaetiae]|uniref:Uncharacterized protein n=1 Tax=Agromyces protaetiae TaxID=2509455 RepID=A0A4P6FSR3_9MICO|nr:hypothetical protein [Agromyces protaetiae]QAY73598.1 hypothetical protein ET445_09865 [Agromyces protaetiae]